MANRNTSKYYYFNSLSNLKELPIPLSQVQCVPYKHEILICGGKDERACYSYDTLKNEYKFICEYPSDVKLDGHCVVKLVDNNSQITLLSFGGSGYTNKHTLVMKYVSVWSGENKEIEKSKIYNEWVPFTDNHNNSVIIGSNYDNYTGVRAVIGGSNNHLLFITCFPCSISVFDLNTFKFIKHDTLPTDNWIKFHCFVLKSENGQMIKTNEQNYQMLLFCSKAGLSIEYNEDKNTFNFHKLPVCDNIASLNEYAYVCINDAVLFFGGHNRGKKIISKALHKYSIQESAWVILKNTFSIPLYNCFGILNESNTHMHIIGGNTSKDSVVSTHTKIDVNEWRDTSNLLKNEIIIAIQYWVRILKIRLGWINDFNRIIIKYIRGFELLMTLQAHSNAVSSIRFSADGCKILSASYDKTIRIWDVSSRKQLQIFIGHTDMIFSAKFSPDELTIVSCSKDTTIRLWDANTGIELMQFKNDFDQIWDVDFSPDGNYIASCSRNRIIKLWDVHSGIEINRLSGHLRSIWSIQFSPDGKIIASSSDDDTICLWNAKSGERVRLFKGHASVVTRARFSPNGRFIASCSFDTSIRIWDIETGKEWKILRGHTNKVNDIKYLQDSQTIVSCSNDNTIQLWNVESGKKLEKVT
ncbi:WD-40 repeat-containing protein, partial [Reticulomyxa filosa]